MEMSRSDNFNSDQRNPVTLKEILLENKKLEEKRKESNPNPGFDQSLEDNGRPYAFLSNRNLYKSIFQAFIQQRFLCNSRDAIDPHHMESSFHN